MEIKEVYQNITCSEEEKEKMYEQILQKRDHKVKKISMKKPLVKAAVVFASLLVAGTSVYAAIRIHTAQEVAQQMGHEKLAGQFATLSDNVVTLTSGDYQISYLGKVSGKDLMEEKIDDSVSKEKSYYVVAAQSNKETAEKDSYELVASPFIKGEAPWQCNLYTMGGGSESQWIDGVRYYIYECDNLDLFADRGVYLGVSDSVPSADNFTYDEKTGEIGSNQQYEGVSVVFEMKLDHSKADEKKAEEYLKKMQQENTADGTDEEEDDADDEISKLIKQWRNVPEEKQLKILHEKGKLIKEETVTEEYLEKNDGKEFINATSWDDRNLTGHVLTWIKGKRFQKQYYQISIDEVRKLIY